MKPFNNQNHSKPGMMDSLQSKKQAIIQDQADEEFFIRAKLNSDVLQSFSERMEKEGYPGFDKVQQDAFAALYKHNPRLEKEEMMDPKYLLNHNVIQSAMQTNGYQQLRAVTIGDEIATMVAVEEFCKTLEEIYKKKKDEFDKQQKQVNKAQDALDKALKQKQQQGKGGNKKVPGKGKGKQPGSFMGKGKPGKKGDADPDKLSVKKAMEEAKKARANYKNYVKKKSQHQVSSSFKKSIERTREYSKLIDQWGLNTDSFHMKTSYEDKMELIKKIKNSHKLKKLSKIMGRLKPIALAMNREKTKKMRLNYQGIKLGHELDKAIPAELALLGERGLKMLIYKKVMERNLRQLEYGGKRTLGKGPIVLMCDESGSMSGDPELFAKAVGLALLEICYKQKRDFAYIHFDAAHKDDLRVDLFRKGQEGLDPFKMIELAEYFAGGGTNFENPLTRGQEIINDHKEFSKADMLFITDGQCGIGEDFIRDFNKWKKEKNVSMMSVMIDAYSYSDSILHKVSNSVTEFTDLSTDAGMAAGATTIFDNLIT